MSLENPVIFVLWTLNVKPHFASPDLWAKLFPTSSSEQGWEFILSIMGHLGLAANNYIKLIFIQRRGNWILSSLFCWAYGVKMLLHVWKMFMNLGWTVKMPRPVFLILLCLMQGFTNWSSAHQESGSASLRVSQGSSILEDKLLGST